MIEDEFLKQFREKQRSVFIEEFNSEARKHQDKIDKERQDLFDLKMKCVEEGWIENEKYCYNVLNQLHKIEADEAERIKKEEELMNDNAFIPSLICRVDDIISYNHAIDYYYDNFRKKIVFRTKEYKSFQQQVFKQLYNSNIKQFINKDKTDILELDIRIKVKNVRKDVDNLEKTIIDTICQYLGINDNKIKRKKSSVFPMSPNKQDMFFVKFQNITRQQLAEDDF